MSQQRISTSILHTPNQFQVPLSNSQSLLIQTIPLSNVSLQIIVTSAQNPKPSGDIFKIEYNDKEIMHYMTLKGMQKASLKDIEEKTQFSSDDDNNEERETELAEQAPFEIQQVLGNRLNDNLSLPVYRIASFGLKMMQETRRMLLKEIFLVWGVRVDNKEQQEVDDIVRRIEKALNEQVEIGE